jgi:DNA-binding MarR family transcriptional regulator
MDSPATDNIYWLLHKSVWRIKPVFAKLAEEHDLTPMQVFTLLTLSPNESAPMHTFSDFFACDASNVTGIIERLVSRGLVVREEKPEDRRVKMVRLSPVGMEVREQLLLGLADREYLALEAHEVRQLRVILMKIISSPNE